MTGLDRFLRYTTQKEPALTASFLAAVLLAIVARYLDLTDEDLAILGPVALIVAGVVIRAGVFSPRPSRACSTRTRPCGDDDGESPLARAHLRGPCRSPAR